MGLLRIVLALSVIAGHADTTAFGINWVSKFYAVQAFFVISGFYMAMVISEKYYKFPIASFYRSRALRIFPGYFFGLLLMFAVSRPEIKATISSLAPFTKFTFFLENLVIVGQDIAYVLCPETKSGSCASPIAFTINPPAWSLSVELAFYLVAPFIVRWPKRIIILIGVGTLYHLLINIISFPSARVVPFGDVDGDSFRYYFYPSSFIFFGAGALAYHVDKLTLKSGYAWLILFFIAFAFISTQMPAWHLLIFALAIPELFRLTKDNSSDRFIGELSYPVYILHWPILSFVKTHIVNHDWLQKYVSIGTITVMLAFIAGWILYMTCDRVISRYRHPSEAESLLIKKEPGWGVFACGVYFGLPFAVVAALIR